MNRNKKKVKGLGGGISSYCTQTSNRIFIRVHRSTRLGSVFPPTRKKRTVHGVNRGSTAGYGLSGRSNKMTTNSTDAFRAAYTVYYSSTTTPRVPLFYQYLSTRLAPHRLLSMSHKCCNVEHEHRFPAAENPTRAVFCPEATTVDFDT